MEITYATFRRELGEGYNFSYFPSTVEVIVKVCAKIIPLLAWISE